MSKNFEPKEGKKPWVTSSFQDRQSAERAYQSLVDRGYKDNEIHIMMSDDTRKRYFADGDKGNLGNKALKGAGVGGAVGGAVGATLVAILAAAATLTLPGIGLVIAGPLAGALAGGAVGGAAGGLVGMLVGAGIPEEHAKTFEKDLKDGKIVMGVTPRHEEDAKYFEREWSTQGEHVYR